MTVTTQAEAAPAADAAKDVQLLVFTLAEEEYAFPLTDVREIIRVQAITPIPNAQPHVKGVLNLRGKIVTVVDLSVVLGLHLPQDIQLQHIIVAEKGSELFGFLVGEVTDVERINESHLKPVPEMLAAKVPAAYVQSAVIEDGEMLADASAESHSRIFLILRLKEMLDSLTSAS